MHIPKQSYVSFFFNCLYIIRCKWKHEFRLDFSFYYFSCSAGWGFLLDLYHALPCSFLDFCLKLAVCRQWAEFKRNHFHSNVVTHSPPADGFWLWKDPTSSHRNLSGLKGSCRISTADARNLLLPTTSFVAGFLFVVSRFFSSVRTSKHKGQWTDPLYRQRGRITVQLAFEIATELNWFAHNLQKRVQC